MLAALVAIGVHVETLADTPLELAEALTSSIAAALRERTGAPPNIDSLDWATCTAGDRCLEEIRARLGSDDVLLLRFFPGPTMIRIVAHRMRPHASTPSPAIERDLPRDRFKWRAELRAMSAALYPDIQAAPPNLELIEKPPALEAAGERSIAPWIVLGAGAAALAVGIVFGAQSASTGKQITSEFHLDGELDALESRMKTQALTANILFVTAAAGGIAGLTLAIFD